MHSTNSQPRCVRPASPGKWLVVVLLAVIAVCLLIEVGFATSAAKGQVGSASRISSAAKGGVFAIAGQVTPDTYGLYLVDYENATICVYQYLPGNRQLRLMAARTYAYDRQLDVYNTQPSPREIKQLVEQHRRLGENAGGGPAN